MDFYSRLHIHLEHPLELIALLDSVIGTSEVWPSFALRLMDSEASVPELHEDLEKAAELMVVPQYLADYAFLFWSARPLFDRYGEKGIPEWVFWDTIADMRSKWRECRDIKGQFGTFVFEWYPAFFRLQRFALGRLQYDIGTFNSDDCTVAGHTVRRDDPVYHCHIPSGKSLCRGEIIDSLSKAAAFFNRSPLVVQCNSWLLYPPLREMVTPDSGIAQFMDLFHLLEVKEEKGFADAWRIYGAAAELPLEQWPRDNSLRRGYAARLDKGLPTGTGIGLLLFDSGKIL